MRHPLPRWLALVLAVLATSPAVAQPKKPPATLAERLSAPTFRLDVTDAPLGDVLDQVRRATQLNLVIDPGARAHVARRRVTMQLRNMRVRDGLTLLCQFCELRWHVLPGDILLIARPGGYQPPMTTRVYDIRELQVTLADFPGSLADLSRLLPPTRSSKADEEPAPAVGLTQERLIQLIRDNVDPESWDEDGPRLDHIAGSLVVHHDAGAHRQIASLLQQLQQFAAITIRIDAWLVPSDGGTLDSDGRPLKPTAWTRRLRRLGKTVEHLSVTAYNTQRVHLLSGPEVVAHAEDLQATVPTGLLLDVRPTYSPRQQAVWTELRFQHSRQVGKSLELLRLRTHVQLPVGKPVPVAGARFGLPGRTLVLSASVRSGSAREIGPAPGAPEPADVRTARTRLAKRITVDFAKTPLQDALAFLRELLQVDMVIDVEVLEDERARNVDLILHDAPATLVLDLLTRNLKLAWAMKGSTVFVSTPARLTPPPQTRVWDVRDLISRIPHFGEAFGPRGARIPPRELSEDDLLELILGLVAPDSWEDGNSLRAMYGSLIARNTPAVLDRVDALLGQLRAVSSTAVDVEVIALRDPDGALEAAGFQKQLVARAAIDAFLETAVAAKTVEVAGRAHLHGWNTQRVGLFIGRQQLREQAIHERGFKLDARPVLSVSGKEVHLTLRTEAASAGATQRFATTVHFPTDQALILGGDRRSGLVLIVMVRSVP